MKNGARKTKKTLVAALLLALAITSIAAGKEKKSQRGMLESMQSVPCGAKQRGITGLGSAVASLGVEHVNSHEQLCPQYLLRTDDMDYHIRPMDLKHPQVLSIGHEAEFRINKDRLLLRAADGSKDRKERAYQVVSMEPAKREPKVGDGAYRPPERPAEYRTSNPGMVVNKEANPPVDHPPEQ